MPLSSKILPHAFPATELSMVLPYIIKQNSVRLSLVQHCTIKQTVDRDVVRFINKRIATEKVPN